MAQPVQLCFLLPHQRLRGLSTWYFPEKALDVAPIFLLWYLQRQPQWCSMASPAWTRKEGKNPSGGLNAKGRASYNAANPGKPGLKAPQPKGGSRRDSFCARMKGMKAKLTSAKTANDPDSRINKSLRAWNCADGGYVTEADGCATKGKTRGRFV